MAPDKAKPGELGGPAGGCRGSHRPSLSPGVSPALSTAAPPAAPVTGDGAGRGDHVPGRRTIAPARRRVMRPAQTGTGLRRSIAWRAWSR